MKHVAIPAGMAEELEDLVENAYFTESAYQLGTMNERLLLLRGCLRAARGECQRPPWTPRAIANTTPAKTEKPHGPF